MSQFIRHLKAVGIHGRFDIDINFQDGINIIHGTNGTGKTTLLHILANVVNEDFKRFAYLKFQALEITLDDNTIIQINQNISDSPLERETTIKINNKEVESFLPEKLLKEEMEESDNNIRNRSYHSSNAQNYIDLKATYFPAFRTMIEAWATLDEEKINKNKDTRFSVLASAWIRNQSNLFKPENSDFPVKCFFVLLDK